MTRVVLHVGAPKSGTTFLQRALWTQRSALLEQGYTCPGESARDMFQASIEVRQVFEQWGFERADLEGSWARLCREAREFRGTTVMSHELLAAATEEQASQALAELDGLEVHLVLSERDLGRQLMSEWQERVKNGSTQPFGRFRRGVLRQARGKDADGLFWRYHDIPGVLARWGSHLPRERVHLVVAPRAGGDPLELWRRFAAAAGFDPERSDPSASTDRANQTLGTHEIALLRSVNEALDGRIKQPDYARVVKRQFAQKLLAQHHSPRPSAPPALVADLRTIAEEWCRDIEQRGYPVYGDLEELLPDPPTTEVAAPDDVDPRELAGLSAAVIADLLVARAEEGRTAKAPPAAPGGPPGDGAGTRLPARLRLRAARLASPLRRAPGGDADTSSRR